MASVPASKGIETLLIHDSGAEIACAGSNAYTAAAAGVIPLLGARRLTIWGHVDAGAAGSIVSIVVGLRAAGAPPLSTARFYPASKLDDTSTNAVLAAVPGMGSPAATLAPAWSQNTIRPMDIRTAAAVNATDEVPFRAVFDVTDSTYAFITYAQTDAGAAAKILAYYSLSS
jgi:hypothetical protein